MTLMHSEGDSRIQEVMVYDKKSKQTTYYPVQTEFDGGTLVGVHPRGGVVRRDDGETEAYFVYPIGAKLDQGIRAEDAEGYPMLQGFAFRVRDAELAALVAEEPDYGQERDADDANPDAEETEAGEPAELKPGTDQPGAEAGERKTVPAGSSEETTDTKPTSAKADEETVDTKPGAAKPKADAKDSKNKKKKSRKTRLDRPAAARRRQQAERQKKLKKEP